MSIQTSYVINQAYEFYSSPISTDSIHLYLNNSNCCSIGLASQFVSESPIRLPLNTSFNDSITTVRIPLDFSPLCLSSFNQNFSLVYSIDYDNEAHSFFEILQPEETESRTKANSLVNGKYIITRRSRVLINNPTTFIEFGLSRLQFFRFFYLSIKVTLVETSESIYRIHQENRYLFNTKIGNLKIAVSFFSFHRSTTLELITKPNRTSSTTCALISFRSEFVRFSYLNFKTRILNISVVARPPPERTTNRSFLLDIHFSISKLDSPNSSIFDYVNDHPDTFFIRLATSETADVREAVKQINIKNYVYMDQNDRFLVNLTSVEIISSSENNTSDEVSAFISSPNDSYVVVATSEDIVNGPLVVSGALRFVRDIWSPSFDLENSFKVTLDVGASRFGEYWDVQTVSLVLELVSPSRFLPSPQPSPLARDDEVDNRRIIILELNNVYLTNSEKNRTFMVNQPS